MPRSFFSYNDSAVDNMHSRRFGSGTLSRGHPLLVWMNDLSGDQRSSFSTHTTYAESPKTPSRGFSVLPRIRSHGHLAIWKARTSLRIRPENPARLQACTSRSSTARSWCTYLPHDAARMDGQGKAYRTSRRPLPRQTSRFCRGSSGCVVVAYGRRLTDQTVDLPR